MAEDNGMARSIFLSALMVTSVMTGLLFFDIEDDGANDSPTIDSDVPDTMLIGEFETVNITISDEEMGGLSVLITLDGEQVTEALDANGVVTLDISSLEVGSHALQVVATDSLGQDSTWTKVFSINFPDESGTIITLSASELEIVKGGIAPINGRVLHDSIETCSLRWSTGDVSESSLGLPIGEDGSFELELSNIQENTTLSLSSTCGVWTESSFLATTTITVIEEVTEGCTDPSASNYDEGAEEDDGSCEYRDEPVPVSGCTDPSASNYDEGAEEDDGSCEYENEPVDDGTGSLLWWEGVLLCDSTEQVEPVDDYNTTESDNHLCQLSFEIGETEIVIDSNGIPNHDLESGPGCCTSEQNLEWRIPLVPTNQTGCDPSVSTDGCTMAPERDAVAFAVNGVPIFGPEDGPGGDAVAGHEGEYEEDRQQIWLGICHGHSGPGGAYHYHADANCAHWHPDEENNQTWRNYSIDSSRGLSEHSPIVGFALDGYPIYGFVGWDDDGNTSEMKSSYHLKEGQTGYNGIEDYEYVAGLGDLDSCNGHFGPTPDYPEGIYHYHTTWENGEGGIGFPYFINCYRGEVSLGSENGGGDGEVDCSGHGETWGPGIGPPPEGCGGGPQGQSSDISAAFGAIHRTVPPGGGVLGIILLAVVFVRVLAFAPVSPSRAGTTALYHQAQV
ncbi:MAG TPA: YHYH protein [Candidatus Thalassarchaeaceae archaeon]|nr:YHYH protein [Candidatus Thalassarchaeaceae archaeon]